MGRFVSGNDIIDSGPLATAVKFVDILNKPNTLAGYGIIDGAVATNIEFNNIVNKPTTLAGYGITDVIGGGITDFSTITNKPTTLAGYGITDAMTVNGSGTITTLPYSGITGLPTTIVGYGITDAITIAQLNTAVNAAVTTAIAAGGGVGGGAPTHNYNLSSNFSQTVTLPIDPVEGERVFIEVSNGFLTNTVFHNGKTIMGKNENLIIDSIRLPVTLEYISNDWKIV